MPIMDIAHTPAHREWIKIGIKQHHGINLPLFSLHSKESAGIGEYPDLIPMIKWCREIGFDVIQLLPLNDTQYGTSPYSAISAFALNPWHIGLTKLPYLHDFPHLQAKAKDLHKLCLPQRIQYYEVFREKEAFLNEYFDQASHLLTHSAEFKAFIDLNSDWLPDYVRFKGKNGAFLQFLCHQQLDAVKKYAGEMGVFLKGDIPILISRDSIDVENHPDIFFQDYSAGSPPDHFTKDGQNWDFPLYNWDELEKKEYYWWKKRLRLAGQYYHIYRLDHIVGFYRIFAIPLGLTPHEGIFFPENEWTWVNHGEKILKMMLESCEMLPIGEDLAQIPDSIRHSLKHLGICGTKVMRWEIYHDGSYIPFENYNPISMTTVSTHDSETLQLWWTNYPKEAKAFAKFKGWEYTKELSEEKHREILFDSHHTASFFHINLLNEYLYLIPGMTWSDPNDERINYPGTVSNLNWTYRFRPSIEEITSNVELKNLMKNIIQ